MTKVTQTLTIQLMCVMDWRGNGYGEHVMGGELWEWGNRMSIPSFISPMKNILGKHIISELKAN